MRWSCACVAAGLCAGSSIGSAEPNRDHQGFVSVPIELGVTTREGGRFVDGIRPELLLSLEGNRGFAIGPYAELARSSADTSLGAGVTVTYLLASHLSLAPGAGIYHRFGDTETGYEVSLFLGHRSPPESGGLDVPLGVRVVYRASAAGDHEVIVVAQVDIVAQTLSWVFGGYTGGMGMARAPAPARGAP